MLIFTAILSGFLDNLSQRVPAEAFRISAKIIYFSYSMFSYEEAPKHRWFFVYRLSHQTPKFNAAAKMHHNK